MRMIGRFKVLLVIACLGGALSIAGSTLIGGARTPYDTGHCKTMQHLAVRAVARTGADVRPGSTLALHADVLSCVNEPGYGGSGVVVVNQDHKRGLHLLPDAVTLLPLALRDAATRGQSVELLHTVNQTLIPWGTFTAAAAIELAQLIRAAA